MTAKNQKSDNYKKITKKKQGKIFDELAKNYTQTIDHGKSFGNSSLEKISNSTSSASDFIKSKHYWELLKNNSLKIKEKTTAGGIELKKHGPKFYEKICNAFFYFFEALVGRIKLGSQYGTASLEILEKLAKLKELGILTDEEFAEKKKKILDRI
jgi:hypothetical protein